MTPTAPAITTITSRYGERRIAYKPVAIIAAHLALGLPIPSPAVIRARIAATEAFETDMESAIDTSIFMADAAYNHPNQLVAERDLPPHIATHGCDKAHRVAFANAISPAAANPS